MGMLIGLVFSHMSLEGVFVELELDDHVFLIGDVGLRGIDPFICEVLHMCHLGHIVVDYQVLEGVGDVA